MDKKKYQQVRNYGNRGEAMVMMMMMVVVVLPVAIALAVSRVIENLTFPVKGRLNF